MDMHCHPALKPYGRSIKHGRENKRNRNSRRSIWYYDPPTPKDKIFNYLGTVTKFSQSNFTSLAKGDVKIISACLYPPEKGFFSLNNNQGILTDLALNFVLEFGIPRINEIQNYQDYFKDLEYEYDFYKQLDGKQIRLDHGRYQYSLTKNFGSIIQNLNNAGQNIISVVFSIEGAHVFNCGLDNPAKENEVLGNVAKVKNWDHRPLFISIAHHFYNELCGHAESLSPLLKEFLDQSLGMNTGFTDLGLKVMHDLLDNSEGKRIYIDIKHMSTRSREEYYNIIDSEYQNEPIPIIVSHGAVNAWKSFDDRQTQIPDSAGKFKEIDINIYDDEIVRIFDSRGFLGIQLDERRIASEAELKQSGGRLSRRKILFHKSRLIWNQIRHIAEVLDKYGKFGWSTAVIGSDFDGIIDPINGYWTAEELRFLDDYLLKHAYNYMSGDGKILQLGTNRNIDPEEIINRFMYVNAYEFLERYY